MQVTRLEKESEETKRRLGRLEDNDKRHEEDIRQLFAHQEGTKVYVTQILSKIDNLESKLFTLVTQLSTNQEKDRQAERKERKSSTMAWMELLKYVLVATFGAVIAYLFSQGGK